MFDMIHRRSGALWIKKNVTIRVYTFEELSSEQTTRIIQLRKVPLQQYEQDEMRT